MATLSNFFSKEEKPPSEVKATVPQQSRTLSLPATAATGLPTETPKAEPVKAEPHKAETKPEAPKVEPPKVEPPKMEPPKAAEHRKFSLEVVHIEELSDKDLETLAEIVDAEAQHRTTKKRDVTMEKVRALLAESGMSLQELIGSTRKPRMSMGERIAISGRSTVKPKYDFPLPTGGTAQWSGRGKSPLALRALLDGGKKLEDYLIK